MMMAKVIEQYETTDNAFDNGKIIGECSKCGTSVYKSRCGCDEICPRCGEWLDWEVEEEMTLQVETPGGDTVITFEGERDTNRWILDIIRQYINNNSNYRSGCHIYKK
jgi:uncharacterized OB-fold protein